MRPISTLRALAIPSLDVLVGYAEAVHGPTAGYVSGLTPEGLELAFDPARPEHFIAGSLRQDEAWDLPTGTGVVLR